MNFQQPDEHFTWQDHRSIESIFRHHPCADVLVHSNTLNNKRFDVFRESGYQIQVIQYDFNQLLNKTPLVSSLPNMVEKNVVPMVVLYKWGGIYMDSYIILTQPLDKQPPNFVFERKLDNSKSEINLSLMSFEKQSQFLEQVMTDYVSTVEPQKDLSNIFAQKLDSNDVVRTLEWDKFLPSINQCQTKNDSFSVNAMESALAISLPTEYSFMETIGTVPLLPESLCQHVLQNYCVICSKLL